MTSLADLRNEDTEIIFQTIRENVRFVSAYALPTLKHWKATLAKAAIVLSDEMDEKPRKKARSLSFPSTSSSSSSSGLIADDIAEIQSAQMDIKHLLDAIEDKVLKKCKDFIKPTSTENEALLNHIANILDNQ